MWLSSWALMQVSPCKPSTLALNPKLISNFESLNPKPHPTYPKCRDLPVFTLKSLNPEPYIHITYIYIYIHPITLIRVIQPYVDLALYPVYTHDSLGVGRGGTGAAQSLTSKQPLPWATLRLGEGLGFGG